MNIMINSKPCVRLARAVAKEGFSSTPAFILHAITIYRRMRDSGERNWEHQVQQMRRILHIGWKHRHEERDRALALLSGH